MKKSDNFADKHRYSDRSLLNKSPKYDILVVSTWRGNINGEDGFGDTMRGMRKMDELLARYIHSRELHVAVILRAERDSVHWDVEGRGTEESYFRSLYGKDIEIIENDFTKRPIYNAMLSSELTISCLSTALLEAYGFGKKVLYCNFMNTGQYHDYDDIVITKDSNVLNFSRLIDELLVEDNDLYRKKHSNIAEYWMKQDALNETQECIVRHINEIAKKD